jgi:hypothetical protein
MAIIQNAVKITENPKKPVYLRSINTHDFQNYTFKDGTCIAVDGGPSYLRRVGNCLTTLVEDFSLSDKDSFSRVRSRLLWGTYGKNGDQPLKVVRLIDCETTHLKQILKTVIDITPIYKKVITSILKSRAKKYGKTKLRRIL